MAGGQAAGRTDRILDTTVQRRIYASVRASILDGTFPPGHRLIVAQLCDEYGSSQAPVREALRQLTDEGIISSLPYRGWAVRSFSWNEIAETYELREELEAWAVRRIKRREDTVDTSACRAALEQLSAAVAAKDGMAALEADLRFHEAVCELAGSALLVKTWHSVVMQFRGVRAFLSRKNPDDLSRLIPDHLTLLSALENGTAAEAEEEFRGHLTRALQKIKIVVSKVDGEQPAT
ncbi:GntR family transcriptional regulator [Nocardia miyunensis]|uniref:GntR family transcriptional regulator n=1 Tax=Nocardia miyunensis TaxID=282684 RepID=UPI0008328A68|nr:GntR family transcriptional regulator [Nocardia miyunensis]